MYEFRSTHEIAPTDGLAGANAGTVVIVGIMEAQSLPSEVDVDAWLTGDAAADYDIQTEPWYSFRYTDPNLDEESGVVTVPAFAMAELIAAAAK